MRARFINMDSAINLKNAINEVLTFLIMFFLLLFNTYFYLYSVQNCRKLLILAIIQFLTRNLLPWMVLTIKICDNLVLAAAAESILCTGADSSSDKEYTSVCKGNEWHLFLAW